MRTYRHPGWHPMLLTAWVALAALLPAGVPAAGAPGPAMPAAPGAAARQESPHFRIRYHPARLDAATLASAVQAAEEGYARCARVFPVGGLQRKITLYLTPTFLGATGLAQPERYAVAIRVPDLEYLGLDLRYVMTHEIAHVFTYAELVARGAGRGAATGPWGEGIADLATGGFGGIALADWWGQALRAGRLWSRTEWLVDGSERPREADFVRERTCTYAQPALFGRYLAGAHGPEAFFRFYAAYSLAVARQSTEQQRARRPQSAAERAELARLFEEHFGAPADELLAAWGQRLAVAEMPREPGARLALHEHIYGSLREFEMGYARAVRRGGADEQAAAAVREAFRQANRSLRDGDLPSAAEHLARARSLTQPRRLQDASVALWRPVDAGAWGYRLAPRPQPGPAAAPTTPRRKADRPARRPDRPSPFGRRLQPGATSSSVGPHPWERRGPVQFAVPGRAYQPNGGELVGAPASCRPCPRGPLGRAEGTDLAPPSGRARRVGRGWHGAPRGSRLADSLPHMSNTRFGGYGT